MLQRGDPKIYPKKINFSPVVENGQLFYVVTIGEARREGVGNEREGFDSTVLYDMGTQIKWHPLTEDLVVSSFGPKLTMQAKVKGRLF